MIKGLKGVNKQLQKKITNLKSYELCQQKTKFLK